MVIAALANGPRATFKSQQVHDDDDDEDAALQLNDSHSLPSLASAKTSPETATMAWMQRGSRPAQECVTFSVVRVKDMGAASKNTFESDKEIFAIIRKALTKEFSFCSK